MNQVIPNLYIGNAPDAQRTLTDGGFAVWSVGAEFGPVGSSAIVPLINSSDSNWKVLKIWDGLPNQLPRILRGAWAFIDDNIGERPVLVHCMAGKSRSASVVWSYLMKEGNEPLEAYKILKEARWIVEPYSAFLMETLEMFRKTKQEAVEIVKQIESINALQRQFLGAVLLQHQ